MPLPAPTHPCWSLGQDVTLGVGGFLPNPQGMEVPISPPSSSQQRPVRVCDVGKDIRGFQRGGGSEEEGVEETKLFLCHLLRGIQLRGEGAGTSTRILAARARVRTVGGTARGSPVAPSPMEGVGQGHHPLLGVSLTLLVKAATSSGSAFCHAPGTPRPLLWGIQLPSSPSQPNPAARGSVRVSWGICWQLAAFITHGAARWGEGTEPGREA